MSVRGGMLALVAAIGGAAVCAAQTADCVPCQAEKYLKGLPSDYEAVFVVSDAARQRQSPAGRTLGRMLEESSLMPDTVRAWRGLAAVLDWTGEQAFDELLGRKVTIVMRGLGGDRPVDWAVLTEVTSEAERRLRQRLRAAPRGSLLGLTVLAVEDGKYELAVGRPLPAGPGDDAEATTTVLLAPGGGSGLFTQLAPSLISRSGLAAPASAWRVGRPERDCDVVLMLRQRAPEATGAAESWRFLAVTGTLERDGWDAHLACSPGLIWERPIGLATIAPWSDAAAKALERDAVVAIMGVAGGSPMAGARLVPGLADLIPALPLAMSPDGRRIAIVARMNAARERRDQRAAAEDNRPRIGADARARPAEPPAMPRWGADDLCVTLAMEGEDAGASITGQADSAVARLFAWLGSGEDRSDGAAMRLGIDGDDQAFRTVPLDDSVPMEPRIAARIMRFFGEEPWLTWGGRTTLTRREGAMAAGYASGPQVRRGWWAISLAPSGGSSAERDAGVLSSTTGTNARPRLSVGMLRPAALYRWLAGRDVEAAAALAPLRRVDTLRWDAWLRDDGTVEGVASLRLTP
jgi:hypothetical protein